MNASRRSWLAPLAICALAPAARAQQPVGDTTRAASSASIIAASVPLESLPPFARPNGMLLRPGTFVYQLSTKRDTLVTQLGVRTVEVTETSIGGVPGWLIAESRTGSAVPTSDSLFLTRADLSPARWVATNGSAQLAASFTRDSMFGAMQSYQGRASFASAVPPGALLTPGMVERVVELLPLAPGYRAGATLLLLEPGRSRVEPAEIVVERGESVALPDRSVDCWVVALRAGAMEERLWVAKDSPRVVKTEQATAVGLLSAVLMPGGGPAAGELPLFVPGAPYPLGVWPEWRKP